MFLIGAAAMFPQPPVLPASPTEDLIGNTVFAVAAIALIGVAALRLRRRPAATPDVVHHDDAAPDTHRRAS